MASGRLVGQRPDCHTFLCKFWHFQMALSQWKLAWLTPNLGILWISVSSFWLCESIVANPIIYRLVPRPSRFETRQCKYVCVYAFISMCRCTTVFKSVAFTEGSFGGKFVWACSRNETSNGKNKINNAFFGFEWHLPKSYACLLTL